MVYNIKKLLLIVLLIFTLSSSVMAAITFTDGYWSTSFNCANWTQPSALSCDGLEMTDDSAYATGSVGSTITSDANMTVGSGYKGYRTYFTGDSHNTMSTPAQVNFPSAQTEFWVRFYYRLPSGQYLSGTLTAHKILYTVGNQDININWPYYDHMGLENRTEGYDYIYGSGGNRSGADTTLGNWAALYGGTPSTTPADGTWHCFEFYFSVGTTSNNGIFRMWMDGVNVINDTSINFGGGAGGSFSGFSIPHNHNVFALSGNNPHDIDDIAIATSSYTGFTTNTTGYATGLNMIGPTDWASVPTVTGCTLSGASMQ